MRASPQQSFLLPKEHYGIAILSNLGDGHIPEMTAMERNAPVLNARRQAEESEQKQRESREARRRKDTTPSLVTKEYAGSYEDPAYGNAQVPDNAGKLELDWHNWHLPLEHYQFDTFRATSDRKLTELVGPFGDALVQFRLFPNGQVESLRFLGREFYRRR